MPENQAQSGAETSDQSMSLEEKIDRILGKMDSFESHLNETTLQMDRLRGDMLSLRSMGGGSYLPPREPVPQGISLQEGIDTYIPPNPFY